MNTNQPTRLPHEWNPAVFRHFISSSITFALCCLFDVGIVEYRQHLKNKPHTVVWQAGETQTNYVPGTATARDPLQIGFDTTDGRVVWRTKP